MKREDRQISIGQQQQQGMQNQENPFCGLKVASFFIIGFLFITITVKLLMISNSQTSKYLQYKSSQLPSTPFVPPPIILPFDQNISEAKRQKWKDYQKLKDFPDHPLLRQWDFNYYEQKYKLSKYKKELPICIVTATYMINRNNYIKDNLNSIFMQNYSNYHIAYYDDASTDGTYQEVINYIKKNPQIKNKITVTKNPKNIKPLANYIHAAFHVCKPQEIFVLIDGDDFLIGRQVFKLINAAFQDGAYFVYTNFRDSSITAPWSRPYSEYIKRNNLYRHYPYFLASHLQAFYVQLLRKVDDVDFRDRQGNYFSVTHDAAIVFPILQLAYPRVVYLPEIVYYYNSNTGLNDRTVRQRSQVEIFWRIVSYPSYSPITDWSYEMQLQLNKRQKKGTQNTQVVEQKQKKKSQMLINDYQISNQDIKRSQTYLPLKDYPNNRVFLNQKNYYEDNYNISQYSKEIPFCVVVPAHNSNFNYNIRRTLNSVFEQQYKNYHVVYIDDLSTDATKAETERYIFDYPSIQQKIKIISNQKREGLFYSIYLAARQHCKEEEVMVVLKVGNQLVGRQALKILNSVMQGTKSYFIYTASLNLQIPQLFPKEIITNNDFRKYQYLPGSLQAFYVKLLLAVNDTNFKHKNGEWIISDNLSLLSLPLLQLSNKKIQYLPQMIHYESFFKNSDKKVEESKLQEVLRSYPKLEPIKKLYPNEQ